METNKAKILVVDDSGVNRELLKDTLGLDYDIIEAKTGNEAIEILHERVEEIDLVLLDLIMPEINGFGVLEVMNKNKWIVSTPVIVISSDETKSSLIEAYKLGIMDYCVRPFDMDILEQKIRNALRFFNRINVNMEDAINMLGKVYYAVVKLYLSKDTFEFVYEDSLHLQQKEGFSNCYTKCVKAVAPTFVSEENIAGFFSLTDKNNIMRRMKNGEDSFSHTFKFIVRGEAKWVDVAILKSAEYSPENPVVLLYFRNVDGEYRKKIEGEKRINATTVGLKVKKNILVIDDELINRVLLKRILEKDYNIIEKNNGQDAYEYLQAHHSEIDLIILDLMMPVMDGYEFLEILQNDSFMKAIPVIVATGQAKAAEEIDCLKRGASDFIMKPYNPELVLSRIKNIVRLQDNTSIVDSLRFDSLTGVYSQTYFYHMAENILSSNPDMKFDLICSDIENFKLINERYGIKKGDEVLKFIANKYRRYENLPNVTFGRINADVFALLTPHTSNFVQKIEEFTSTKEFQDSLSELVPGLTLKFGLYENVNPNVPVSTICDRAKIAVERIKGMYGQVVSKYDDSLRLKLLKDQQILDCCEEALEEEQFQVWYQPKHNIQTEELVGAEALIRWIHPTYGFMSPGEFIPLFEKNGFITSLDMFVWEKTCENISNWVAMGNKPIPVSVNISRADFMLPNLKDIIYGLVEKYNIDMKLLHLEVTESAYTEDPATIIHTVNEFRNKGFVVEMDDFGSGYSSLNMFGELELDILKLDMGFVHRESTVQGHRILQYVINMAKTLDLAVIAEGVETDEQLSHLREMGCDIAQGYYFSKPLPKDDFEKYLLEKL